MNFIENGDFFSGFASGAVSSLLSSGFEIFGNGLNPTLQKVGMIAVGGVSGGLSSVIAGGNFWSGMRQGLITSGLNHALHSLLQKGVDDLDKFAKEKYGDDYKTKYGVKSLKWASEMGNEVDGFHYDEETKAIMENETSNTVGGMTTRDGRIYISDFHKDPSYNSDILESSLGHEFIHSYHKMKFGPNFNPSNSEYEAYRYQIDFALSHIETMGKALQGWIKYQSYYSEDTTCQYDYKKIPGF